MSSTGSPITIALVNDYEIIVEGLREMLKPFADRVRVVETVTGDTPDGACDIALFDTFAGRRHALARVRAMLADHDIANVVLYTWDAPAAFLDDVALMRIDGVILKSETGARLVESLEAVHRGDQIGPRTSDDDDAPTVLTEREREVLALIAKGASNREIAAELYLSVDPVKTHVRATTSEAGGDWFDANELADGTPAVRDRRRRPSRCHRGRRDGQDPSDRVRVRRGTSPDGSDRRVDDPRDVQADVHDCHCVHHDLRTLHS